MLQWKKKEFDNTIGLLFFSLERRSSDNRGVFRYRQLGVCNFSWHWTPVQNGVLLSRDSRTVLHICGIQWKLIDVNGSNLAYVTLLIALCYLSFSEQFKFKSPAKINFNSVLSDWFNTFKIATFIVTRRK